MAGAAAARARGQHGYLVITPSQVQLLLEQGADPTAAEGGTPLVTEVTLTLTLALTPS